MKRGAQAANMIGRAVCVESPRINLKCSFNIRWRDGASMRTAGKLWSPTPGMGFTVLLPSAHRYYLPKDSEGWTFFWFIVQHPFVGKRIAELRRKEAAVQTWKAESPALESAAILFEAACRGNCERSGTSKRDCSRGCWKRNGNCIIGGIPE